MINTKLLERLDTLHKYLMEVEEELILLIKEVEKEIEKDDG